MQEIKTVLIVGSGTMGRKIAFLTAAAGFETRIYDISEKALADAQKGVERIVRRAVARGAIAASEEEGVLARISSFTDMALAAKDADFISESIPEDPALKGRVFGELNRLCPEHAIFTTNTSSLMPSMFAGATGRPDRFAALHFHNPEVDRIVDIMPHPGTSKETMAAIQDFVKAIRMIPIEMHRENPGYVFNSMFMSLLGSALTLAARGVASPEDVDRSWMGVMQMPIGPFGMMDQVGLETVWKITDYWASVTKASQAKANAAYLKPFVDEGKLGAKTGTGFYSYPAPAWGQPDFLEGTQASG
ncbi:3-hydroxyacyl-CoA dehydrogenase [Desulfobotulus alkaliphilus]|uniref:3-hydroxyacyl-CoA dehydrogenase n=1 Tax=Desulfobotulus alkaliphilus TaxID=622671 RepID=A0A562RTV6_9BACT|nr:3-hydroxyacyl-CoA dehydrogenase [Desulfobotulus alkaliphilus]TWI71756.1 3-hydroxyacyl-CoA dehydrogenase [Desulfobotulus alkaliphilus]